MPIITHSLPGNKRLQLLPATGEKIAMLRVYAPGEAMVGMAVPADTVALPAGVVWFDLFNPSQAEDALVEAATGISVPTAADMAEIESSSRLYTENGAIYVTATLATGIIRQDASTAPVSFVLTDRHLVTVRYAEIPSFDRFANHLERSPVLCQSPGLALVHLIDAIVDRLADGFEHIGTETDAISRAAFRRNRPGEAGQQRVSNLALQVLLTRLGATQDALSKARESAVSLSRALGFLQFALPKDAGLTPHIKTQLRDLASLTDQANFISNNLTFLLDAALGLISIEQNAVLKIFSVVAIIFMPPTMVAGIYGMNFAHMPELAWPLGYPLALLIMLASAILPYGFFRWKGWL